MIIICILEFIVHHRSTIMIQIEIENKQKNKQDKQKLKNKESKTSTTNRQVTHHIYPKHKKQSEHVVQTQKDMEKNKKKKKQEFENKFWVKSFITKKEHNYKKFI